MAKTRILEESERTSRLRTRLCAPSWNARWHSSISRGYLPPNNCIVNDRLARSDEKLVSKGAVHLRSCYHEEIRRVSNLQASNHCRNELFGGKKVGKIVVRVFLKFWNIALWIYVLSFWRSFERINVSGTLLRRFMDLLKTYPRNKRSRAIVPHD